MVITGGVERQEETHSQTITRHQTERCSQTQRKGRGNTQMRDLYNRNPGDPKINISWNEFSQPVGKEASKLKNFLGTLAKDKRLTPLTYPNWRKIPKEKKNQMWEIVTTIFELEECKRKWVERAIGDLWRKYKARLKSKYYKTYSSNQQRIRNLRDDRVNMDDWKTLIQIWDTEESKMLCLKNSANRAKKMMPHTTGTKSFARVRDELTQNDPEKRPPSMAKLWKITHTRHGGAIPSDEVVAEKLRLLEERASQMQSTSSSDNVFIDEVFSDIMGPQRPGQIRGLGFCPMSTNVQGQPQCQGNACSSQDQEEVIELRSQVASLIEKNEQMSSQLTLLTSIVAQLKDNSVVQVHE